MNPGPARAETPADKKAYSQLNMSCYTASCHAHSENDEVLGSLIIRMPLNDLD
ncbi:MAG: hypothetical protein MZV63_25375 [Marinilabiliales bacterium]|nr:hypothetical protein [Marinilabiliales bacterium]